MEKRFIMKNLFQILLIFFCFFIADLNAQNRNKRSNQEKRNIDQFKINYYPIVTENAVDIRYSPIVFEPMVDNVDMSFKLETPLTIETKTKGIAINLSKLTNIIPQGLIQSFINSINPKLLANIPKMVPSIIPIIIFQ